MRASTKQGSGTTGEWALQAWRLRELWDVLDSNLQSLGRAGVYSMTLQDVLDIHRVSKTSTQVGPSMDFRNRAHSVRLRYNDFESHGSATQGRVFESEDCPCQDTHAWPRIKIWHCSAYALNRRAGVSKALLNLGAGNPSRFR